MPADFLNREDDHPIYVLRDAEKSLETQAVDSIHHISTPTDDHSAEFSNFDPNLDDEDVGFEEDSPYPEVRSAVANTDDTDMPVSTIRAWTLGIILSILLPGMNQFFFFRYPSVTVGSLVAQLVAFPLGRIWARFVPTFKLFGHEVNPGPFTIKEHVLVTVMAGVGAPTAYATEIVAVQRLFYDQIFSFSFQWMLVMSTQLIGFSIGGLTRRFLVSPASMIWPNTLVSCALFNTLHSHVYVGVGDRGGTSRERYFTYAFLGAALWYIVPGYLFQALSIFSWVCWIAPNNIVINQLFGYRSGLGFSILTFDWNQIAAIGSPLATPWWAEANIMIGFVAFFWILTPILYYTNTWHSKYMPLMSLSAYDQFGAVYNVSRIMKGGKIDMVAYQNYSPLYLPTTFALAYGLTFLSIAATITHAIIHFSKPIKLNFGCKPRENLDIHAQLMSRYRSVPEWYFAIILGVTFTFACICIEVWSTGMTIWALVIALLIAVVYVIPIGMIQAITNKQITLGVITELIVGFMLPGRPVAMMMFKTYGYITMAQALQFAADLKLGHYMKVPPRSMFWCQIVATTIAGTVQLAVQSWMFSNIPNLCQPEQADGFLCARLQVFGTASVMWGVIGPGLQFAKGQVYSVLMYFFIIGAACPVLLWLLARKFPKSRLHYINFPLIFSGVQEIPPASALNYVPWAVTGFIFQYIIRRKHFSYWAKYNYILSAALDGGTAISVMLVYFCLQYPSNGRIGGDSIKSWWGNVVHKNTLDWKREPYTRLPQGQIFGSVLT